MSSYTTCDIKFNINGSESTTTLPRQFVNKIPDDKAIIINELTSGKPYEVKSQVTNETFKAYIEFWKEGKLPTITHDNIWEFFQLSDEFGPLNDHIITSHYESLLLSCLFNSNSDKSPIEKQISIKLDYYLINEVDELSKIDTNTLYNIFYHKDRKLKNVDKAYEFILNLAKNRNQNAYKQIYSQTKIK